VWFALFVQAAIDPQRKRAIERLSQQGDWVDSGQGWRARESVVSIARLGVADGQSACAAAAKGALASSSTDEEGQLRRAFLDIGSGEDVWEYQVLGTFSRRRVGELRSALS